jgi:hypothetical protein
MVTSTKSVARKASAIVRRKFFPPIAAAVALAALAAPSASAARTTGTGSESAAACPDGTLLAAVSAQRLPAGATAYKYDLPNGTSFENIAPPSGFNDVTASSALLSELNMPRRPAGAAAMKAWEAQVAPFARSGISGSEKFCEMAHAAPEPEAGTAGQGAPGAWCRAAGLGRALWEHYLLRLRAAKRALPQGYRSLHAAEDGHPRQVDVYLDRPQ